MHVLTTPLVTKADGTKFGKTEGGTVWLDADADVALRLLPVLAQRRGRLGGRLPQDLHRPDPGGDRRSWSGRCARSRSGAAAQRALAADVTTLVHGAAATAAVQAASEALFGKGDPHALDARHAARRHRRAARGDGAGRDPARRGPGGLRLVDSRNAARRVLGEGGVSVNNVKVSDPEAQLTDGDFLHGEVALLRRGRKSLAAARRAA